MPGNLHIIVSLLSIASCFSQEEIPRPSFPDVFQTEIEGTFVEEDRVVEIDSSMYFDRRNNRAALFVTKEGDFTRLVFNFNTDESLSINDNDCDVQKIPDEQGFFPFKVVNGKKTMSKAEEAFFFTKSVLNKHSLTGDIPTLIYKATLDIPQFGQTNCDLTHIFSKPDFELSICKEGIYCNSTLITLSVQCKNDEGQIQLDHVYRFSRFKFEIEDESVFLPPPGIYCDMKSSKEFPSFPPYFSFTFDIIEMAKDTNDKTAVFNTYKEVWYDAEYKIIRIDEYDYSGLLFSSRIFDLKAEVAFTIIATVPTCDLGPITENITLDDITRLPKSFFAQSNSAEEKRVYVGERQVHGLNYQVWSLMWEDKESEAQIVEEVYFLQIVPNKDILSEDIAKEAYSQISHSDVYTYEMNDEANVRQLVLLKYFSINNYRSTPKEWSAFDVSTCFNKTNKKEFKINLEKFPLVKGSRAYRGVLETFYNRIIAATGVSVVRISELTGIFDGVYLTEVRGSIIDNSETAGWPTNSKEPGMDETFQRIVKAASVDSLSFVFLGQDKKVVAVKVTSVEEVQVLSVAASSCFSGASLAAASLVLLMIGIAFGIIGFYVFLKRKRSLSNAHVRMTELTE